MTDRTAIWNEAMEALKVADSWLERWAVHVGNCEGGERCTCGLTRVRYDVAAAIRARKIGEG